MSALGDTRAFPQPTSPVQTGMTLRQYYAGLAMQGLLADPEDVPDTEWPKGAKSCAQAVAMLAVEQADALLAELERGKQA